MIYCLLIAYAHGARPAPALGGPMGPGLAHGMDLAHVMGMCHQKANDRQSVASAQQKLTKSAPNMWGTYVQSMYSLCTVWTVCTIQYVRNVQYVQYVQYSMTSRNRMYNTYSMCSMCSMYSMYVGTYVLMQVYRIYSKYSHILSAFESNGHLQGKDIVFHVTKSVCLRLDALICVQHVNNL